MHCIGKPLETSVAFMSSGADCSRPTVAGRLKSLKLQPWYKWLTKVMIQGSLWVSSSLDMTRAGFIGCFPEQMSLFTVHLSLRGFPGGNDEINYHLLYISMSLKDIVLWILPILLSDNLLSALIIWCKHLLRLRLPPPSRPRMSEMPLWKNRQENYGTQFIK